MGKFKKQRDRLEAILMPLSLAAGAGIGFYLYSKLPPITAKPLFGISIISASIVASGVAFKLLDELYITPYYKMKASGYSPEGWRKYIFNKEGKCIDVKEGKDLSVKKYERDL